jgi:PAS domain S-box-containing protein
MGRGHPGPSGPFGRFWRSRPVPSPGSPPPGPPKLRAVSEGGPELERALLRASPDAVIVVDASGRIEMASPAAETLFGWPPEELVGQAVELLVPEDARHLHERHRRAYAARPTARAMGSGLELRGRRRDGSTFPVDVSLAPVVLDGTWRVGVFVRDATERRRGEDLLRHVNEISRRLLAGRPTAETLGLTAHRARGLVGASAAWVVVPAGPGTLTVAAADGEGTEALLGAELSGEASLSARAMAEGAPIPVADMAGEPAVLVHARPLGLGPGLYLPMAAEEGPIGALVVARPSGQDPFTPAEADVLEVFASASAIVLALGRAREELEALCLVAEHDRIARDLHDTVIQRLFALGMNLQSLERLADGVVGERIGAAVGAIDEVIREIRETIFDLSRPDTGGPDIRRRLRQVAGEAAAQLGFEPRVGFRGPVEAAVSDEVAPHLLAAAREALSNVARHARAQSVEVVLSAQDGSLVLSVADDGVGTSDGPSAGHGLANLAARADRLGGKLRLSPRRPRGTVLEWQVPSRPA